MKNKWYYLLRIEELKPFEIPLPIPTKKYLFVGTLRSSWDPGGKSFTCRTIPSIAQLSCHQHIGISYKMVSVKGLPRRYWILTPNRIETCAPWSFVAIPSNIGLRFVAMGELRHILRKILTVCCQITSFKQNLLSRTGACCEIWSKCTKCLDSKIIRSKVQQYSK